MYFAAAPFLGVAVYYLLRIVATDVTQPALVIASFGTGLISDKIVAKVIEIAEKTIGVQAPASGEKLAIESISPSFGEEGGGTRVTISGKGFTAGASVDFGGRAGTDIQVLDRNSIEVTVPPYTAGAGSVDVKVTTASGVSKTLKRGFNYVRRLSVASITPKTGPTAGGEVVTISGTGLSRATQVTFGDMPAAQFRSLSDSKIEATTPSHAAATVDVTVEAGTTNCVLQGAYVYT
jgi:hypothetical protein